MIDKWIEKVGIVGWEVNLYIYPRYNLHKKEGDTRTTQSRCVDLVF